MKVVNYLNEETILDYIHIILDKRKEKLISLELNKRQSIKKLGCLFLGFLEINCLFFLNQEVFTIKISSLFFLFLWINFSYFIYQIFAIYDIIKLYKEELHFLAICQIFYKKYKNNEINIKALANYFQIKNYHYCDISTENLLEIKELKNLTSNKKKVKLIYKTNDKIKEIITIVNVKIVPTNKEDCIYIRPNFVLWEQKELIY